MAGYNNINKELSRMKDLMNYGKHNTSGRINRDILEHCNLGADGKTYGIIREGSKYVIKVMADGSKPVVAENFDYIGGFMNKKQNTYDSFTAAIRQFDQRMMELKEAYNPEKGIMVESLDPRRKEYLFVEGTEEMKREIARQRQIMANAKIISEGKNSGPCCDDKGCGERGDAKKMGAPFGSKEKKKDFIKANDEPFDKDGEPKKVNEAEVLGWNKNPDYMDKTHGTEIGDGKPFDKDPRGEDVPEGCVNEALTEPAPNQVNDWDKGVPKEGGTGKVETSDGEPFDKKASCSGNGCGKKVNESVFEDDDMEALDSVDDAPIDDQNPQDTSLDLSNPEGELDADMEDEDGGSDLESLMNSILSRLDSIEAKLDGSDSDADGDIEGTDDDSLYGDDDSDIDGDEMDSDAAPMDDMGGDDVPSADDDDDMLPESRQIKEDKTTLNDFGKHPAYRKEPFEYPNPNHQEKEGYHDWNDKSVEGAKPYGETIGDGTPFTENPEDIENSIAESKESDMASKIIKEAILRFFGNRK